MKKIYLLTALALGTLFNANSQIIFNTSIESWSAGLPTDMYGAKSNIAAASVTQVTGSSMYGSNCVRLANATTTHKRFTTQPLTVTDTKTYEIKFWVMGDGEIRTGLFDGRSTGSGYATYNPYITIASSSWTMYQQNIVCANDTVAAEFIFSVVNTVAPNHIMIDSIVISEIVPSTSSVSIYDIQYTTAGPLYVSPYNTQIVNTGGIVSAIYTGGYFLQSAAGEWRGIEVNDAVNMPAIGDSVTLTATVEEFFNYTRLTSVTAFSVVNSGNTIPGPATISTTQGNTENYEGVFARSTAICVDASLPFGMWAQYTAPDTLKIDDLMYNYSATNGLNYQVTGVVSYSYAEFKLNPRMLSDIVVISSVEEMNALSIVNLFPNPANTYTYISNLPINSVLNLFDINGKLVYQTNTSYLNTASLESGIYELRIVSNTNSKSVKLVVSH